MASEKMLVPPPLVFWLRRVLLPLLLLPLLLPLILPLILVLRP